MYMYQFNVHVSFSNFTMTCDKYQYNDIQESLVLVCAKAGSVECYDRLTIDRLTFHPVVFITNFSQQIWNAEK